MVLRNGFCGVVFGVSLSLIACDGSSTSGPGGGGAGASTSTGGGGSGGVGGTTGGSGGIGGGIGGMGTGGGATTSTGGGLPANATFHLNYTQVKDWSKCAERDFVVFDLLDTPKADFGMCKASGAKMLCYFSSQYEDWRDDAGDFGALAEPLDGWPGENWVDPSDPANLNVMKARLYIAVEKGCDGVDVDNIDHAGHEDYIGAIFDEARARGLLVSQKNAIEKIDLFWNKVDLYQNEQCQEYNECAAYEGLGRPVHNIEYSPCKILPYLYSHRKDVEKMDAWEEACSP
ncbi:MAG: endo alpha-1,4 polygalactosaminidase [Polyangiaceae bacterium]|nr:endo alpha-1,4 polygalactosaminidase [Polyangiaceae bacterium]